jgi:rfaE bifunctional protein nucleotidyltransferase chain/domain/rfaE bifunctional protein kinase chain/domain
MSPSSVVIVGDALLDRDIDGVVERLSPDAPVPILDQRSALTRPGGAAFAASLAASEGAPVQLVTAIADDAAGEELRRLLEQAGVEVVAGRLQGTTPEKIRLRAGTQPLLRLDRGSSPGAVDVPVAGLDAIEHAGVVVVSDYGRGLTSLPELRAVLAERRRPTVWDPHPRGAAPVPNLTLVTPNLAELRAARTAAPMTSAADLSLDPGHPSPGDLRAVAARAEQTRLAWDVRAVATTMGPNGALLVTGDGPPLAVPGVPVTTGDPCGAGDRFVTAVARRLSQGALVTEAVTDAVAQAGQFVAAGGAAACGSRRATPAPVTAHPRPHGPMEVGKAVEVAAQVRGRQGTLVVAGGCFDLLHAGHLSLLEAARRLGDFLLVAINSDRSVRRLKGEGRPVVPEADRAALLGAIGCVDGVVVFDEDSPIDLLCRLRPHVFVKGGDYSAGDLPEEPVLRRWGGQAVVVPYLTGRSTTRLLEGVNLRS